MRANVTLVSSIDHHPTYTVEVRSSDDASIRIILYRFSAFRELNNEIKNNDPSINLEPFPITHKRQSLGISLSYELLESRCLLLDKWLVSVVSNFDLYSNSHKIKILDFLHISSDIYTTTNNNNEKVDNDKVVDDHKNLPLHFHAKKGKSRPVYSFNPSMNYSEHHNGDHHHHHHHHHGDHHHSDVEQLPGTLFQGELKCIEFNITTLDNKSAKDYLQTSNSSTNSKHQQKYGSRVYIVLSYLAIHIFKPLESNNHMRSHSSSSNDNYRNNHNTTDEYTKSISGLNIRNNMRLGLKRMTSISSSSSHISDKRSSSIFSSDSEGGGDCDTNSSLSMSSHFEEEDGIPVEDVSSSNKYLKSVKKKNHSFTQQTHNEREENNHDEDVKQGEFIASLSLSDIISVHESIEIGNDTCVFNIQVCVLIYCKEREIDVHIMKSLIFNTHQGTLTCLLYYYYF